MNNILITQPTKEQLFELEKELKTEFETYNSGFYRHWDEIERAFNKNDIILFQSDSKIVGFVVVERDEIAVKIDLFQIIKPFQNKGLGGLFYKLVFDLLKREQYKVIHLHAVNDSQSFWVNHGFIKVENTGKWSIPEDTYFKTFVDTSIPNDNIDSSNKIEIWNSQLVRDDEKANWAFDASENFKPIIFPAHGDWQMKWTKNGIVKYCDGIKYLGRGKGFTIHYSPFVYIEKLPPFL